MVTDEFEWDEDKARTNIRDHGVSFEEATFAFDDIDRLDDIDASMNYGEAKAAE